MTSSKRDGPRCCTSPSDSAWMGTAFPPSLNTPRRIRRPTGVKYYQGQDNDGNPWNTIGRWFVYKTPLLVDSTDELSFAFTVTKASVADITEALGLLARLAKRHPLAMNAAPILTADRATTVALCSANCGTTIGLNPSSILGTGGKTRRPSVGYPDTCGKRTMAKGGFEQDRNTLKNVCPVDVLEGVA